MKKSISIFSLFLVWSVFSAPTVYSEVKLSDIERVILAKDFYTARNLASQGLAEADNGGQAQELKYYLGLSYLNLKDLPQAKKTFEDMLRNKMSDSTRDKVYLGLIDAYYLDGDYEAVEKTARKMLKAAPETDYLSLVYLKLAKAHLKLAQWTPAREYLEKIIMGFPDSMDVSAARKLLEEKQYFAVQVGSFLERARAEKLVLELTGYDEYAYIVETAGEANQRFYRVRVGQLTVLQEAEKLKMKLSKLGYPTEIFP